MFPTALVFEHLLLALRPACVLLLAVLAPVAARAQLASNVGVSFALVGALADEETGAVKRPAADADRAFAGRDDNGVPRYARRFFSAEDRRVLREGNLTHTATS